VRSVAPGLSSGGRSADSVLFSGFRFTHHNEGSGYDGIVADPRHYVCGNRLLWGGRPETTLARKLNFVLVDLVTLWRGLGYSTVHYFYPENTVHFSPLLLKCLGKRVVYTLHLDEQILLSRPRTPFGWLKRKCFKYADLVISLSSQQTRNLQRELPGRSICFVPHGLAMEAPVPEPLEERFRDPKVVVVGSNYRDFDLLQRIVAGRGARPVTFHLVGLDQDSRRRFLGVPGVVVHGRLGCAEYRELLQSCLVMALPLVFATANNALLEAHKFHLPALCSDIPGARDYATCGTGFFPDADAFWQGYDRIAALERSGYRDLCLRSHREAVGRFSWDAVRLQLDRLYASRAAVGNPVEPPELP
jgi:glycosyltransferase involved in cell wall biosynthesis